MNAKEDHGHGRDYVLQFGYLLGMNDGIDHDVVDDVKHARPRALPVVCRWYRMAVEYSMLSFALADRLMVT